MALRTGTLRRVYVRPPDVSSLAAWRAYGWHREPDPQEIEREHTAFRRELSSAGAEVICGDAGIAGDPDAIYAYDPVLISPTGAILLHPGKEGRRREPDALAEDLE